MQEKHIRTFFKNMNTPSCAALMILGAIGCLSPSTLAEAATFAAATQRPALLASQSLQVPLTTHATIPSGQTAWIDSVGTTGTHGTVSKTGSTVVTYTPGSYYASLASGTSATDKFSYCLEDTAGSVSCGSVDVTIFGAAQSSADTSTPATSTSYTCLRNWYVSQNGSDKAAGTASTVPWQTLQHANDSGLLRAGDCVNVAPGTYNITNTIYLTQGGNANSATGYVVYRSTTLHGAKIKAAATDMFDMMDADGNYMIIDGFEIDGSNLGLTSAPFTYGSGLFGGGHHFQALNNLIHDCGGAGIAANYKDWYWIEGNVVYDDAYFSGFHASGISIYEPAPVSFTATSADTSATFHIIVNNNTAYSNSERYVAGGHTDGNGIILDDFRHTQSNDVSYPYKTLIQSNKTYGNGGRGVHVFYTDNVTIDSNTAYDNNLDNDIQGSWRGELSNAFGSNNTWTNNAAAATSVTTGWLRYNTAVLDGHAGTATVNVIWQNNANFDTRTAGKSYQIDNPARATAFPAANPLGKAL